MTGVHSIRDEDLPEAGEVGVVEGFLFGLIHKLRQHIQAISTKGKDTKQGKPGEPTLSLSAPG